MIKMHEIHVTQSGQCNEKINWIFVDAKEGQVSMLPVVTPVKGIKKSRRKNSFRFSSKKQLSRARMNRRLPRMIGVDLSGTTKNLTYEDIVTCEMIPEDVFEHQTPTCEAQPHIVSEYNEDDEEEEDYDKDINGEQATQYEEDEQPSEAEMEIGCTNEMVRE